MSRSASVHVGLLAAVTFGMVGCSTPRPLVFQTDFGLRDGAVSAMKGVAADVDPSLRVDDLTHLVPPFNVWEGAYRLAQSAPFWPPGTVFVSVVDPGVGTERKSVVMKSESGHFFVTPDNGTLTLVARQLGVAEVREIDEQVNRRVGSEHSHTFHGRDVYALTGARLAAGRIGLEGVGPKLAAEVVSLPYEEPRLENGAALGTIPILDTNFGNVWTDVSRPMIEELGLRLRDRVTVVITHGDAEVFNAPVPYVSTFGDVPESSALLYVNSLDNMALAINLGSFAGTHRIGSGPQWRIKLTPAR